MADLDLIDALESAARAFTAAQAALYEATGLDATDVVRHYGRAWGVAHRELWLRRDDGEWSYETHIDLVRGALVRDAGPVSAVLEFDDETGNRLHTMTAAMRDDAAAAEAWSECNG